MYNKILIVKHIESEGAGTLETYYRGRGFVPVTLELGKGEPLPVTAEGYKAVIIMGGPMSVYDEDKFPFLKGENKFIKELIKAEVPFLGICLGAQLLAKAAGAKVVKAPVKEIGWSEIRLTEEGQRDPIFKNIPKKYNVFQWHGDMFLIPDKGTLLCDSENGINQAFKYGKNAYGLQFHIEATPVMIGSWIKGELPAEESKNVLLESYKNKVEYERRAHIIYSNFGKTL